jgi:hypothetical protein
LSKNDATIGIITPPLTPADALIRNVEDMTHNKITHSPLPPTTVAVGFMLQTGRAWHLANPAN